MIQIYGQIHDRGSFSNVTRAYVDAIHRASFPALIYGVGTLTPTYEGIKLPTGLNSRAPIGIYFGYPLAAPGWLQGHAHKILVTVCETDRIPQEWVNICNAVDEIIVPSQFCLDAFRNSGVRTQINIIRHGVHYTLTHKWRVGIDYNMRRGLLHVTGAASFPYRKGTGALLEAWRRLRLRDKLLVIRSSNPKLKDVIKDIPNVLIDTKELPTARDVSFHYEYFDAVVQPSRGEGFGLVPLEARCVGVPTILTNATGHQEYFDPELDVGIETGRKEPMRSQGNDIGSAPSVSVKAIERAILHFYLNQEAYEDRVNAWASHPKTTYRWLWPAVLKPFIVGLRRKLTALGKQPIEFGAEASLKGL